jgi:hypothetical protein
MTKTRARDLLDRMPLREASIARVIKAMGSRDFAMLTAFRASNSKGTNRARNREMMAKHFRPLGMGGTAMKGSWMETQADGSKKEVSEDSFMITRPSNVTPEKFRSVVLSAIREYEQDAAVIGVGGKISLLFQNGKEQEIGTKGAVKDGDVDGAFSRIKGYKVKVETYFPESFVQALEADSLGILY